MVLETLFSNIFSLGFLLLGQNFLRNLFLYCKFSEKASIHKNVCRKIRDFWITDLKKLSEALRREIPC